MINKSNQKQDAGNNSTNLQAQSATINNVVNNNGITYADAKEIALDVFNANFPRLRAEAAATAQERAEDVTEKFFLKLHERNPEAIKEFEQPAMQDALFTLQKQYAKSGDKELGDLLVDILVDRAAEPKRNMLQIVLDESLTVAPKLTIEQLDTITINFLLVLTRRIDLLRYTDLINHFTKRVCLFIEGLTSEQTYYNHIEYLGCGHVRAGNYGQLENNLRQTYKVFFSTGFTLEEVENEFGDTTKFNGLLIPCFHDNQKLQLNCRDDGALDAMSKERGFSDEEITKLKNLVERTTMPQNEVKDILIQAIPSMTKIFEVWDQSPLKNLELTSVGVAIAHANYRRKTSDTMNLSIWIK
jgi:hypothetical protein